MKARPAAGEKTSRWRRLVGEPSRIPRVAWSYGVYGLSRLLGPCRPGSASFNLLDRSFNNHPHFRLAHSVFARATASFNQLTPARPAHSGQPRALVFLLRGHAYSNNLHNYLVACQLRALGYRVGLVVCTGQVEHCGTSQYVYRFSEPPFTCNACRTIIRGMSADGFDLIDLNSYRSPTEDEEAAGGSSDRWLAVLSPFLMRFYSGDVRQIHPNDPVVASHLRAAARYLGRFNALLDELRPACLCLFNGLFFPECLFLREALTRRIPTICVERGMRKDSMFVSLNEPACHYRSDLLWELMQPVITAEQIQEAQEYLRIRVRGPEDPTGRKRVIANRESTDDRYARLSDRPYVVLFAPVTHDTASMEKDDPCGGFFEALRLMAELAKRMRHRLVVRSHPDELFPFNPSRYTVRQFLQSTGLGDNETVICLDSNETWNPYELAKRASARVVYNGTLGMELPALGLSVFNIANSHYSRKGFTNDLKSPEDFTSMFRSEQRPVDNDQMTLALKYLYFYVFVANLPVDQLLNEKAVFRFDLAESPDTALQQEQLAQIRERLAFYLQKPPTAAAHLATR